MRVEMIKVTPMNTITMIVVTEIWYGISTGEVVVIFVLLRRGLPKDEDTVDGNEEYGDSVGGNPLFLFCLPTFIFVKALSDDNGAAFKFVPDVGDDPGLNICDSGVIEASLFHRK